jgi:hypothetical protein
LCDTTINAERAEYAQQAARRFLRVPPCRPWSDRSVAREVKDQRIFSCLRVFVVAFEFTIAA